MTAPNNKDNKKYDVFISYLHEDQRIVYRLFNELKQQGLNIFLDTEILPGSDWENKINESILQSSYFVPVFSKSWETKRESYAYAEVKFAIKLHKQHAPNDIFIITVKINKCEIPFKELNDLQGVVNLFSNYEEGLKKILKVVKPEKRKSISNNFLEVVAEICPINVIQRINQFLIFQSSSFQEIVLKHENSQWPMRISDVLERIDLLSNFNPEKYSDHERDLEIAGQMLDIIPQIYEEGKEYSDEVAYELVDDLENRYNRFTDEELKSRINKLKNETMMQDGAIWDNLIKVDFIDKGIGQILNIKKPLDLIKTEQINQWSKYYEINFMRFIDSYKNPRKFSKWQEKFFNDLKQDFVKWENMFIKSLMKSGIPTLLGIKSWTDEGIHILNEFRNDNTLIFNPFLNINKFRNRLDTFCLIQIAFAIAKSKGKLSWDDFCKTLQSYAKFQRYEFIKELDSNAKKWVEAKIYQFDDKRNLYLVPEIIPFINMHQSYFENYDESQKLNLLEGYINHVWGWAIV